MKTTSNMRARWAAAPEPKREYCLWVRQELVRMHADHPFSDAVLTSLGVDPAFAGTFFNSNATVGEAEWLDEQHGMAQPTTPAPRKRGAVLAAAPNTATPNAATAAVLAAYGPLGDAVNAAISTAIAEAVPPAVDEAAVRSLIEKHAPKAMGATEVHDMIRKALATIPPDQRASHSAAVATAISEDSEAPFNLRMLSKYAAPGNAKKPVRFASEPGASKTWAARRFGRLFGANVFDVSCHAGTTQREFIGAYVPFGSGFEKVYGKLARAFISAVTEPTLLILDEINRLPLELMSVFCGALNRQNIAGVEYYVLDTGLPDGAGGTEEIKCPCHLLSIVSTCNEGVGFNTTPEDKAEAQRWIHIRVSFTESEAKKIAGTVLDDRWGVLSAGPGSLADKLVLFITSGRNLALTHNRLKVAPTIRCVVDAINIAASSSEADIADALWVLAKGWFCGLNQSNVVEPEHLKSLASCFITAELPFPKAEVPDLPKTPVL